MAGLEDPPDRVVDGVVVVLLVRRLRLDLSVLFLEIAVDHLVLEKELPILHFFNTLLEDLLDLAVEQGNVVFD